MVERLLTLMEFPMNTYDLEHGYNHTANCANCGEIDNCRVMTENWQCFGQLDFDYQHAWLVCFDCIAMLKCFDRQERKTNTNLKL